MNPRDVNSGGGKLDSNLRKKEGMFNLIQLFGKEIALFSWINHQDGEIFFLSVGRIQKKLEIFLRVTIR